jgi:AcrR family transcriptional regulator
MLGPMSRAAKKRKAPVAKAERRLQILHAARGIFAKRGYHQTTIDDIVLQAGVARGTFYLYFEDKRAIVTDDPARSVGEQVHENIRRIIGICLAERPMTKILLTDAVGVDPTFDRKLAVFYDNMVGLLVETLKEGQGLGIVADGEPRVLAYMALGALKELLYQAVTLGLTEESAEVLTQQIYAFLCDGFLRVR